MRHDPERMAAAYLAGELGPRQRERFEAHMLACDECWREVKVAVTAGRWPSRCARWPRSTCASASGRPSPPPRHRHAAACECGCPRCSE